jgi:hypothetical protein
LSRSAPEVVDVDEGEGEEEQELRPLRGVAQEDLDVLDQQGATRRGEGQAADDGLEEGQPREARLAGFLGLAPGREVVAPVRGPGEDGEGEGARPRPQVERSPARAERRVSPAQKEGRNGVTGDCRVAKKAVTSGRDWTSSSRSGRMKRRRSTIATAKSSPMSISRSRARRAGKTLTRPRVMTAPRAEGIATKGTTVATAIK